MNQKMIKKTTIFSLLTGLFLALEKDIEAKETPLGTLKGIGPYQQPLLWNDSVFITYLARFLSNILGFITIIGAIFFFIYFIVGALSWLMAAGKPEKIQKAQETMTNATIGLVVIVAAYTIAFVAGRVLGVDFLNLQEMLTKLAPGS